MSEPQWQNLPMPREPGGSSWAGFSADPRDPQSAQLRASDADRTNAAGMLGGAYAEGRLDKDEYDQRLDQVMSSKSLGELVPVLADVVPVTGRPAAGPSASRPARPSRGPGWIGPFPRWWLGLAVMFNVIWLMTSLSSGHLIYYWPMWPMLGTAIPMIMGFFGKENVNRSDRRSIGQGQEPPQQELR